MVSHQKIGISLRQAFGINRGEVISLVGGGGKTTLMFALAHELEAAGEKVISTTTTRILEPTAAETFLIVEPDEERLLSRVRDELNPSHREGRHITVAAFKTPDGKLKGISPTMVDQLASFTSEGGYIIVEADGAARKPLKAPNATEPVIPESTTLVIAVVGMDALGCRLTEENVFRPEIISGLTGLAQGGTITADTIATLITHAEGIIKGSPAHARIVPLINKIDIIKDPATAGDIAGKIMGKGHPQIRRVVLGHVGVGDWGLRVRE